MYETVLFLISWAETASEVISHAFTLRIVYGFVLLFVAYCDFKLYYLLNKRGRLARISQFSGTVFLFYGIARILVAYPDVFLGGLLSNLVNITFMGWLAIRMYKNTLRLQRVTENLRGETRAAKIIDTILDDLRKTTST
jgi:hypothetical protein